MKDLGKVMWMGSGAVLWFLMMNNLYQWWDVGGVIAGFILAPGVVVFPLLYWFKEGVFPVMYFIIWGIGVVGLFISRDSSEAAAPAQSHETSRLAVAEHDGVKRCGNCGVKYAEDERFCSSCGQSTL